VIHIPQQRYGVKFDYDQRNGTYLVVSLDPLQSKQLVPYQLQMLLNNKIPQLLNVELDSKNDSYQLQYDLSSKRRLFQMLQTSPPSIHLFYEMAFRLVQTIADSSMYMLNEEQYILHGDFIFCGRDVADLYLCYLPLPTTYSVRIEDQLRLLLLRMLGSIDSLSEDNEGILKIIKLLQEEDYLIPNLKNLLKDTWMKLATTTDKTTILALNSLTKEDIQTNRSRHIWVKIKSLWNKQRELKSHSIKSISIERKPITGVTEMLVKKQESGQGQLQIVVNKNGVEEVIHFLDDRFIIGRNQSGVHYMDTTEGISRVHCEFVKSKDTFEVRDLGSLNGSYLNGELLVPYKLYPFRYGDSLRIVTTEIRIAT
jgi:hypothetical protein